MEKSETSEGSGPQSSAPSQVPSRPLPLRSYGRLSGGVSSGALEDYAGTPPLSSGSVSPATSSSPSTRVAQSSARSFKPNIHSRIVTSARPSPYGSRAPSPKRGEERGDKSSRGSADLSVILAQSLKLKSEQVRRDTGGRALGIRGLGFGGRSGPQALGNNAVKAQGSSNDSLPATAGYYQSKASIMARNMKLAQRAEGKRSKSLLELPWANATDGNSYNPLSLPFVLREQEMDGSGTPGTMPCSSTSKRPTVKHVDEVNRNASVLFQPNGDCLSDGDVDCWYLIQMPAVLPALAKRRHFRPSRSSTDSMAAKAQSEDDGTYGCSSLYGLPSGFLGKLVIRRSGKVRLLMSDYQFDVNLGSECNFAQEVACHDVKENELTFVGKIRTVNAHLN
eukprot:GHVQ01033199.1.p1 GENE.GHVQ01033199.1~~GHVQ01033199.1.p1  ORF type:complete len:393 (+),score=33.38 GHVQ01033199.1:165-1343(+)